MAFIPLIVSDIGRFYNFTINSDLNYDLLFKIEGDLEYLGIYLIGSTLYTVDPKIKSTSSMYKNFANFVVHF